MTWLRRGSYRYPPRNEAMAKAKVDRGRWMCAYCKAVFTRKEIQVDHKKPVIDPKTGFTTWDNFINRLFCDSDEMQVLCKSCHSVKTKIENESRKSVKKKKLQTNK